MGLAGERESGSHGASWKQTLPELGGEESSGSGKLVWEYRGELTGDSRRPGTRSPRPIKSKVPLSTTPRLRPGRKQAKL
jgi:hypothetical protein